MFQYSIYFSCCFVAENQRRGCTQLNPSGQLISEDFDAIQSKCNGLCAGGPDGGSVSVPRFWQVRLQNQDPGVQLYSAPHSGRTCYCLPGHLPGPAEGLRPLCLARPPAGLPRAEGAGRESGGTGPCVPGVGPVAVATVVAGSGVDLPAHLAAAQRQERPHRETLCVPLVLRTAGGPVLDDEPPDCRLERGVSGHQGDRDNELL